jgi:MSHA biogenesis protein MshK
MVGGVMRNLGDMAVAIMCGLALLADATVARAQAMADPTRPPASLTEGAAMPEGEASQTGLQTIIRRAGAKPAAVINGEYVVLGGRVGDARLVKVGEDSVTLKSAAGLETLMLIPGVEKKMVRPDKKKAAARKGAGEGVTK